MAEPVNRRTQMAEARRGAILMAARGEFVGKGFAAARVDDIARQAGVAKGTVYLNFPDKEQLFEAVVLAQLAPLAARLRGQLAACEGPLRPAIEPLLQMIVREFSGDEIGPVLRLLISEAIRFPHLADRYRREVLEPMLTLMRLLLTRAGAAGELRNPATADFPQLVMAPIVIGLIWQGIFGQAMPLDMPALLRVHLDNLFEQ